MNNISIKTLKEVTKELGKDKIYGSFISYMGQNQEGKNDYQVGCIQTANALGDGIAKLVFHAFILEKQLKASLIQLKEYSDNDLVITDETTYNIGDLLQRLTDEG